MIYISSIWPASGLSLAPNAPLQINYFVSFARPRIVAFPRRIPTVPFPMRWANALEFAALVRQICENAMLNGKVIRTDGAVRLGT